MYARLHFQFFKTELLFPWCASVHRLCLTNKTDSSQQHVHQGWPKPWRQVLLQGWSAVAEQVSGLGLLMVSNIVLALWLQLLLCYISLCETFWPTFSHCCTAKLPFKAFSGEMNLLRYLKMHPQRLTHSLTHSVSLSLAHSLSVYMYKHSTLPHNISRKLATFTW